jgi:hypothetical protein
MEEKLNLYLFFLTVLALVVSVFSAIWNPYCLIILVFFGLYLLDNRHRIKSALIVIDFVAIVSFPVLLLIQYILYKKNMDTSDSEQFFASAMLTVILLIVPFSIFYNLFIKVLIVANHEKDHFDLINSYPNVICKEHLAKTKQYSTLGFKTVHCRKSTKCFARGHVKALNLVGLIGDLNSGEEYENDYYITLWDYEHNIINDGDYDIIEIQESEKINDYDAVINRVITFFYNELNRFKPIKEVTVRIVGNPEISESTKRLLKERFLKLEYVTI